MNKQEQINWVNIQINKVIDQGGKLLSVTLKSGEVVWVAFKDSKDALAYVRNIKKWYKERKVLDGKKLLISYTHNGKEVEKYFKFLELKEEVEDFLTKEQAILPYSEICLVSEVIKINEKKSDTLVKELFSR